VTTQWLPTDFDWEDPPSQVTPDAGRAPIDLPSVLQPWDPAPIRDLHGFAREAIRERAKLALEDPENEAEATTPMSSVRARWILLTMAAQDAEAKFRTRSVFPKRVADMESGRDLLTRLGADPNRGRGVIRCPAHDDRGPSLSWRLADDGRALLHCVAGCDVRSILAAAA
jgi:hypothetical protein